MGKYEYRQLNINELYINPENYRYINDAEDEISAIIYMFNVTTGAPTKEMLNLSKDIVADGLNPFEMPIVCYDDDMKKYVVYDGNRRVTCIKLMTQYKDNATILDNVPSVDEIYKLDYEEQEIQCVISQNADDAKYLLNKIHQDINEGIGRKQWDSQAKMKAAAAEGNKSKTYAIVEFLKGNPKTDPMLISAMDNSRWVSKLERVIGFAKFREAYNITFGADNSLVYHDSAEQVLLMMSKLVSDLIRNSATANFRFKADFENYIENLDAEFKTQVIVGDPKESSGRTTSPPPQKDNNDNVGATKSASAEKESDASGGTSHAEEDHASDDTPRPIPRKYLTNKVALRLGKNYSLDSYDCLNEKGKEMLVELEALDIKEFPVAAAALCRALLECVAKLWIDSEGGDFFNSKSLASTYRQCINLLRNNKIIDDKSHKVLSAEVKEQNYIDLLNTWIHSDTSACVSETNLVSGWKNTRLLIEKYIETHKG